MRRRQALVSLVWLAAASLAACGSRTPLLLEGAPSTQPIDTVDSGVDAGVDAPPETGTDAPKADVEVGPVCPVTPPTATWMKLLYPSTDNTLSEGFATTVDNDGSIFAVGCGIFDGCADSLRGSGPCWVMKTNADGHLLFVHRFVDGINDPLITSIAPDGHGGVIVGIEDDEGVSLGNPPDGCAVERVDDQGNVVFSHSLPGADCGGASQAIFAFASDRQGHSAIVAGCGEPASPLCNNTEGAIVEYLDATGEALAQRIISGDGLSLVVTTAAMQTDGTLLIGGYLKYGGTFDFGSGPKTYVPSIFFATYDPKLGLKALRTAGEYGRELQAVATADGTGFVLAGTIDRGTVDFGGGPLKYSGMLQGGEQNDLFLARFDKDLVHVFSHSYGDTSNQDTVALCTDADGTISWLGKVGNSIVFDNNQVVSGGADTPDDGFLVQFAPQGVTSAVATLPVGVDQVGCLPGKWILVGNYSYPGYGSVDFGDGQVPPGDGFVLKRNRQ